MKIEFVDTVQVPFWRCGSSVHSSKILKISNISDAFPSSFYNTSYLRNFRNVKNVEYYFIFYNSRN